MKRLDLLLACEQNMPVFSSNFSVIKLRNLLQKLFKIFNILGK